MTVARNGSCACAGITAHDRDAITLAKAIRLRIIKGLWGVEFRIIWASLGSGVSPVGQANL
ncbi:hypothetical protein GCM10011273_14600 [Asticcacaulis endophyticus]|uniref:Uncharacterized protein n=1 Tax=Asticcacaulis endophyticus TaxID=1395890 RepID=A0A918Q2M9_9CAUL|nr:hypothetical protein GCM10011273_14600 [Asticcacaulis endophyticus]